MTATCIWWLILGAAYNLSALFWSLSRIASVCIISLLSPFSLLCKHTIIWTCALPHVLILFQQKLEERIATLSKVKFTVPKDREKWEKVLTLEVMSSEDSGMEEDEEILVVRPLPWRSTRVDEMFDELDKKILSGKSPRSRRQMKRRKVGNSSKRPRCTCDSIPKWAFAN